MDLYKPIYHFMPKSNWINDPNGPIYYKGEFHLFYQHNPYDYHWNTMHWGHAKSKDLVHWEHLPIALYPSNELGEFHCFSGCTVIDAQGIPTIFYTSIGKEDRSAQDGAQQWIAVSHDDMITWHKDPNNPILTLEIHGDIEIKEWRDPFVWKDNEIWYMVAGGSHNNNGCVLLYSSKDLIKWNFISIIYENNDIRVCECPNFFKLKDRYVLIYSSFDKVEYVTGTLSSDNNFKPINRGIVDYSGLEGYYGPTSFLDSLDRRIMLGWIREVSRGEFDKITGWSGSHSIPRIVTLNDKGSLIFQPIPEIEMLRYDDKQYNSLSIEKVFNTCVKGRAVEIIAEVEIENNEKFSIDVLCSEDSNEKTSIIYDAVTQMLTVDRSISSLSKLTHHTNLSCKHSLNENNILKLHIFIDQSIIEIFADYTDCISTKVYPTLEESDGIYISSLNGEKVNIKLLNIYKIKSIW